MTDKKPRLDPKEENVWLKKRAEPAPVPEDLQDNQEQATRGLLQKLWNWVRGYTADEVDRLKEAGVQKVEAEASKAKKKAKKIDAEAEKIYAEAERERQEARKKELERRKERGELEREALEEKAEQAERVAEAVERVEEALSRIRQKGGDVAFDEEQLQRLLESGLQKGEE